MTLRIGMIGAGWHALADHAPALRQRAESDEFRGRIELAGVFDLDVSKAQLAAEQFGFRRAYEAVEALLSETDAVLSIVPSAVQIETLKLILKHDKPALIEKPLGRSLAEAERIARMLEGRRHMVSLNRRFDPAVTIARQWMSTQSPPRVISGTMTRVNRQEADFIWSTGIHLTDLLCFLAGPATINPIDIRRAAGRVEERVELTGDGWSVEIHTSPHQPWCVRCATRGGVEVDRYADPATPSFERNGTVAETTAFLRGILNNQPLSPTVADAMPGTRLASSLSMQDE